MTKLRIIVILYSFLLFCHEWRISQAELYTAITELEPLLMTYRRFIDDLDGYLRNEEERILVLKKYLNIYNREQKAAMKDISKYIGNPINAFTLIKRLTSDLSDIGKRMETGYEYIKNISMLHNGYLYPTEEDLKGATLALARVRDTYLLNVTDLAEGILNGVRYSSPMSASDCYQMGKVLYNEGDYKNTIAWMLEALRKHKHNPSEAKISSYTEVDILEFISYTHYLLDDFRSALQWTYPVLALEPNHPRVAVNVPQYKELLEEQRRNKSIEGRKINGQSKDNDESSTWDSMPIMKKYEKLCRGEMMISSEISNQLTCRYLTENHPFLRLAPIKIEQHYIQPDIYLVHDVMRDDEIDILKEMAKPRFRRAEVIDSKTGQLYLVSYRINKIAWFKDIESKVVARISQRISDFTGFTMFNAEELQVTVYGIGGHYEPHLDFSRKGEAFIPGFIGNRMATVIIYMSNVEQGGATVFTELGLSVFPVKNAALFFTNVFPSCEGDMATRHAACPVLKGYKWVSTKWIHTGGQEFIRPCQLEFQEEGFSRSVPQPVPKLSR